MMKMAGKIKTFISYSSQDSALIQRLHGSLDAVGANPYVAEWWLEAGQPLADKIRRNIEDSTCLLTMLSDEANNSAWVHEEIGYAIAKGIPVIPVLEVGVKVRGFLEGLEYIPYDKYDFDETIYKILTSIRAAIYLPAIMAPRLRPPIRALDTLRLTCKNCNNQFTNALPAQDEINKAIERGLVFSFDCPSCHHQNQVNPKTFALEP
jgi:hypothetical protein